jgi:hypothetical protein
MLLAEHCLRKFDEASRIVAKNIGFVETNFFPTNQENAKCKIILFCSKRFSKTLVVIDYLLKFARKLVNFRILRRCEKALLFSPSGGCDRRLLACLMTAVVSDKNQHKFWLYILHYSLYVYVYCICIHTAIYYSLFTLLFSNHIWTHREGGGWEKRGGERGPDRG